MPKPTSEVCFPFKLDSYIYFQIKFFPGECYAGASILEGQTPREKQENAHIAFLGRVRNF